MVRPMWKSINRICSSTDPGENFWAGMARVFGPPPEQIGREQGKDPVYRPQPQNRRKFRLASTHRRYRQRGEIGVAEIHDQCRNSAGKRFPLEPIWPRLRAKGSAPVIRRPLTAASEVPTGQDRHSFRTPPQIPVGPAPQR
ncbi:MAG: hypothetical protein Ct9H300mP16_11980 [Pseudomonadota bacterium]|nr:MAG: hypothetical protein Ct9H300mP16_11980 [Pseudomonadota bacterium]